MQSAAPGSSVARAVSYVWSASMPSARPRGERRLIEPSAARTRIGGWSGARGEDGARCGIDGHAGHRHEVSACQLAERDFVRLREERGRVGIQPDERPERELRKRHVRGRRDPVPAGVTEHHGELAVGQPQEVVDVASDLDAGRRLVDGADLETFDLGQPTREQRALHRVGEVLPLLGQPRVVDRERGLPGDENGGLDLLVSEPPSRIERDDRQRGQQLRRGCNRDDERGRALLEERD